MKIKRHSKTIKKRSKKYKRRNYTRKKYSPNLNLAFRQGIIMNYYICSSIKQLLKKFSSDSKKKKKILEIMKYSFTDVSMEKIKEITNFLYTCLKKKKSDADIIYTLTDWYKSLLKKDKISWPVSYKEYIKIKIDETISKIDDKNAIKGKILLDIGAGDCALTRHIGRALHMRSVAVDIKDDVDWSGSGSKGCKQITKVFYDGSKLTDVMRELDKKFKRRPRIGCVMYNHSLHHFGSISNIKHSLQQSYKLLDKNGYLLVREHNNQNNDISINLQHIFIALRYIMDSHPEWTGINVLEYYRYFITHYTSHFFSKKFLISECKKLGYKFLGFQKRTVPRTLDYKNELEAGLNPQGDVSKTILFTFKKIH